MKKAKKEEIFGSDILNKKILSDLTKKYGEVLRGGDEIRDEKNMTIPISPAHDRAMGGVEEGSFLSIAGPPGGGKTSLALEIIRNAQQEEYGSRIAWFDDVEARLKKRQLYNIQGLNCHPDVFKHFSPKTRAMSGEERIGAIEDIIHNQQKMIIVIDSLSAMKCKFELEDELDGQRRNGMPRVIGDFVSRNSVAVRYNKHIVISIHHIVADMSMSRKTKTATGGNKARYACDNILTITHTTPWLENDKIIGQFIHYELEKGGNSSITGTKYTSALRYGYGIDCVYEIVEPCVEFGIFERSGAWYKHEALPDGKCQGIAKTTEFLRDNPEALKKIQEDLREVLS